MCQVPKCILLATKCVLTVPSASKMHLGRPSVLRNCKMCPRRLREPKINMTGAIRSPGVILRVNDKYSDKMMKMIAHDVPKKDIIPMQLTVHESELECKSYGLRCNRGSPGVVPGVLGPQVRTSRYQVRTYSTKCVLRVPSVSRMHLGRPGVSKNY